MTSRQVLILEIKTYINYLAQNGCPGFDFKIEINPPVQIIFAGHGLEDGDSGDLFTKIITAMHLTREKIHICKPDTNEIKQAIMTIKPKIVCGLGSPAAKALLQTTEPISRLRGHIHNNQVMVTYAPDELLSQPAKKKMVWEDMQKIMKICGL